MLFRLQRRELPNYLVALSAISLKASIIAIFVRCYCSISITKGFGEKFGSASRGCFFVHRLSVKCARLLDEAFRVPSLQTFFEMVSRFFLVAQVGEMEGQSHLSLNVPLGSSMCSSIQLGFG